MFIFQQIITAGHEVNEDDVIYGSDGEHYVIKCVVIKQGHFVMAIIESCKHETKRWKDDMVNGPLNKYPYALITQTITNGHKCDHKQMDRANDNCEVCEDNTSLEYYDEDNSFNEKIVKDDFLHFSVNCPVCKARICPACHASCNLPCV